MGQKYEIREVEVVPNADDTEGTYELDADEEIIDSAVSRQGRYSASIVLYIAAPTTATRCLATTSDGTRCQRDATADSDYCGLESHGD